MKHLKKIKFIYHNGGFGPIEKFYSEVLIIGLEYISYKIEWNINKYKVKNGLVPLGPVFNFDEKPSEERIDYSWKIRAYNKELVSEIIDELGEEINNGFKRNVLDGDSIEIVAYYKNGSSQSHSYSYCAHEDRREKYNSILTKILPKEVPIPEFLEIYDDEEDFEKA